MDGWLCLVEVVPHSQGIVLDAFGAFLGGDDNFFENGNVLRLGGSIITDCQGCEGRSESKHFHLAALLIEQSL
jgi:hypothetical protein